MVDKKPLDAILAPAFTVQNAPAPNRLDALANEAVASAPKPVSRGLVGGAIDAVGDVADTYEIGSRELGNSAVSLAVLYGQMDPGGAADYIQRNKELSMQAGARRDPGLQEDIKTIEGSTGVWNAIGNVVTRPEAAAHLSVQNFPQSLPAIVGAGAGARGGASLGAAAGTALPGIGNVAGAATGGIAGGIAGGFAGGVPVEIGAWVEQALQERGADLSTREGRIAAYTNKPLMDEIRGEAERKGLTTAAVDSVWNLFAGSRLFKAAGQGLPKRIVAGAQDIGTQMAGEAVSEGAGQVAAYKGDLSKVSSTDIALEALLSGPQAIGETSIGLMAREQINNEQAPPPADNSGRGAPPPQDNGAPPAAPQPPRPTRDDLAAALSGQPDTAVLPEPAPVPAVTPAPMAAPAATGPTPQGFAPGDTVEHVNRFGEIVTGTVEAIQSTDAGQSATIRTPDGALETIFEGEGPITVTAQAPARAGRDALADALSGVPAAQTAAPAQAEAATLQPLEVAPPATPESYMPMQPEQVAVTPAAPEKPKSFKDQLPNMTDEQIMDAYRNGHRRQRELAAAELEARYPGFGVPNAMDIEDAAAQVNTEPTDGQKEAGNYQKGHISVGGLNISIENPKGGLRKGKDKGGNEWQVEMPAHYGYIKRTTGADGDQIDVYVGGNPASRKVFIVDQIDADTADFDEHKVMLGFDSIQQAMETYDAGFSDNRAEDRIGGVTIMDMGEFQEWLKTSNKKKPVLYKKPEQDAPRAPQVSDQRIPGFDDDFIPAASSAQEPETTDTPAAPAQAETAQQGQPEPQNEAPAQPAAEDAADNTEAAAKTGDDYFAKEKIDAARNQTSKSRETLIYMTPEDFISMAEKITSDDQRKAKTVGDVLDQEGQFNELPFLRFENDGEGGAKVVSHEGRHRAMALKEKGVAFIPVRFISVEGKGPAIRWGEQENAQSRDVISGPWPAKLESQDGGKFIDFPVEDTRKEQSAADIRKGEVGMMLSAGEVVTTTTGRQTSPFPKFQTSTGKTQKKHMDAVDNWLIQNALDEAEARGDDFNALQFRSALKNPQKADKDSAEYYLFDPDFVFDSPKGPAPMDKGAAAQDQAPDTEDKAAEQTPESAQPETPAAEDGQPGSAGSAPKRKMQDVGEKLEGKRAFQDRMGKKNKSQQAKEIIESTKNANVFDITKREGQTEGLARFAQAIVEDLHDFSAYLKKQDIIKKKYGRRDQVPGWQEQVQIFFAGEPDGNGYLHLGHRIVKDYQAHEARLEIIQAAEEYIALGEHISRMFAASSNIDEFKALFSKALKEEDPDTDVKDFDDLLEQFAKTYSLDRDIFSSATWSKYGKITDESEVKKSNRVSKTLSRPKVETIERQGLRDWRNGRDITAEEFKETFGFRGVEFGEWVNAKEGQLHVNHAFDALHDLADHLGIKPAHISLGGKLGFAFGSRGSGEHAAHYEPQTNVINLTKTKGDGSVAHEWLHALDNNLRRAGGTGQSLMERATESLAYDLSQPEKLEGKIKDFLRGRIWYQNNKKEGKIGNAKMYLRYVSQNPLRQFATNSEFKRDADALGKDYWGLGRELLARAFEAYMVDTLPGKSPYLVSDWALEGVVTKEAGYRGTAFPKGDERQRFNAMFAELLKQVDFSDDGVKFKDDAKLSFADQVAEISRLAESYIPKLGDMMEELQNGTVQQTDVQTGVSDGDGGAGTEDVSGTDDGQDVEGTPDGSGERGRGPVSEDTGRPESERDERGGGEAGGGGDRVRADDTVPDAVDDALPDYQAKGVNHKIAVGALDEKRGQKQKARDNLKIIAKVKEIESEGRPATPEEQELLAKYTGWGSVKNAFPGGDGKAKEDWADIVSEVKAALTDKEYREARRSIQYAHYTSEIVVRGMWAAMERFGLKSGSVFEPGMGIGNFTGMIPDGMNIQYSGLEIDTMTARIARILYPESSVRHADFTAARYADNMFDAAIGNPPFSDATVKDDPKYREDKLNVHNYFFAKTLDMVAPGGVLAFVTSRYSMDSRDDAARKMFAEQADLIGAIRLPDTAFKTNAHTEVVTDIIFLRKRLPGEESNGVKWAESKPIDLTDENDAPHHVNEYFLNNPEMVLGEFAHGSMYSNKSLTVSPVEAADLQQQITEAISRLPEGIVTDIQKANTDAIDMQPSEKKEGSYYLKDGVLMQVDQGVGLVVPMRGKGAGGITKAQEAKIKGLIPVRNALREVMSAMVARDDKAMKAAQKEMRKHYDAFVKKHGPITKSEAETRAATASQIEEARDELRADYEAADEEFDEGDIDLKNLIGRINPLTGKKYTTAQIARVREERRAEIEAAGGTVNEGDFDPESVPATVTIRYENLDAFKGDPEYYNLMILENYNQDTGEASLTDVFDKNIIAEVSKPQIKTAVDALNYSLSTKNAVDIELMARELGKNPDAVSEELEQLDLLYRLPNPAGGNVFVYSEEYLSGQVKDKLAYAKKLAAQDSMYQRNVDALEAVQPKDIPASDINTQLGSPYFDEKVISDFMRQELNIPVAVSFTAIINHWEVTAHDPRAPENTTQYGTSRKSASELMASLLMRRDIKVTDKGDNDKQVVNVPETQAAQDKAKALQEKFDEWIWKSSHSERVFRHYNDHYNNIVPRKFDGSHITTAISPSISLRKHQKDAIWRIIQTGNTYLAHAVGAGKTLEMAAAAMEMRRLGQWRKPLLVVPNHMLAQFSGEFRAAYPQAKIFVADEQNFHTDRRRKFVANVAKGDWDAVIMTYSSFKKLSVSPSFEGEMMERELERYRAALTEAGGKKGGRGTTASKLEKAIQKMETKLKDLRAKGKDESFTFEELGIDAIELDEAHYFRKLSFATMQGSMKGVNPIGSKAAWDLYIKSKFLDTIHPGRYLVMASGTPLTNTLAEIFTIQRFMNERALEIRGINNFDAWSSVYAASVTNAERQPSGAYKNVTRLAEFRNLRSLSQMVMQFMDTVTSDELGALVDRPALKTGTMIIRTVKPTREYLAFQKYLQKRTEDFAKATQKNAKGADNILAIIGEGRQAAIDMRMIDPTLPESESKLEDMIDNVFRIWKDTSGDEFMVKYRGKDKSPVKGGTQLIFSDLGVKGKTKDGKTFSPYEHIKRKLIRMGIPASEIAFIADYDTAEEKRQLFKKVNSGEVRILIGSTGKMGTGTNVQNRLKAVHNLDAPWLPADIEQRNGRALRQGNQYKEIEIYGYGTEASYDSTMWGMLETKAKAIIQFLKGDTDLNSMRDIEETDHFRMAKAMTSGDARVLKQAELQSEVEKLARQSSNFRDEQVQIRSQIAMRKTNIERSQQEIKDIDAAVKKRVEPKEDEFLMTILGKPYTERAEAAEALGAAIQKTMLTPGVDNSGGVKIGEMQGFDLQMFVSSNTNLEWSYELFFNDPALVKEGKQWSSGGDKFNASGAITKLTNTLNNMPKRKEYAQHRIEAATREIPVLESQISENFPKQKELADKREQLAAIDKDLRENAPVEIIYEDFPIEYWEANKLAMNAKFSIAYDEEFDGWSSVPAAPKRNVAKGTPLREQLEQDLTRRLKQIGFDKANIAIVTDEQVRKPDGTAVQGAYHKSIIWLSMSVEDPVSILNHEAIHALRDAGAFTEQEWRTLEARAKEWRKKFNIESRYEGLSESAKNEEAIAEAFREFALKGPEDGPVKRIYNRVVRFLQAIRDVLQGKKWDFKTIDDIFSAIDSGEITPRIVGKDGGHTPGTRVSYSSDEKTDSPSFKKWFGSSKVVDADGKPLVVYHGTGQHDIDSFNEGVDGIYFTSDRGVAEGYAQERMALNNQEGSGKIEAVYLSIKNPLIVDDVRQFDSVVFSRLYDQAIDEGRDGIIVRDVKDNAVGAEIKSADTYIAFRPEQIKSVNNRGTFDPNDARIMYSLPDNKKEALDTADAAIDNVRGMQREFRPSIGKIASYILHPHQIASLYKSFTPVYTEAINMMKSRDVIVHRLSNHMDLYNKMDAASKKKVDAVLEIGRLTQKNFIPERFLQDVSSGISPVTITAENVDLPDTHHSKPGEKIELDELEAKAYAGVRMAMNAALDTYMQVILEEYGFTDQGITTKAELTEAMSEEKDEKALRRMQEAMKMLQDIEAAKRMGYIPLKRWGDVAISVRLKEPLEGEERGELMHFERVEIPGGVLRKKKVGENKEVREAVARIMQNYPESDYDIDVFEVKDFTGLQAKFNINELDVLAASSDMSGDDYNALRAMIEDAQARRGFKSHFFKAKDVAGYSPDFERALNDYVVSIAGHLARRKYARKLEKAIKRIEEAGQKSLFDYARKYVSYISEPKEEWGALRNMAFLWYLSGNIASGVTNALQPFMVTAPWLKSFVGHGRIAKEMARAYKEVAGMVSLEAGTDIYDFDKAPNDVRIALKKGEAEGDFVPLNTYDAMAIATTNVAYMRGLDRMARQAQDVVSLTFSMPERTNRIVTYIVAYRIAIDASNYKNIMNFVGRNQIARKKLVGKTGEEFAREFADFAVFETQLRMGKLNRPTLARGFGTVPFTFMSFTLQMLELMDRLSRVHGGKKGQSIGLMLLAVVFMAGVKGFPFEDDIQKFIEFLHGIVTRTDLDIDREVQKKLRSLVGETAADAIMKGVPYALLNVDMSGRLGFGNIVPDDGSDALGVIYDMVFNKPKQFLTELARGDAISATATISPAFIRNPLQAYAWSQDGVRSGTTGDTVIPPEELDSYDIGMKALGFTSGDIAKERNRIRMEQRANRAVDLLRGDYYDRLARAMAGRMRASADKNKEAVANHQAEVQSVLAEIARYNETAPDYKRINIDERSLKQRVKEEIKGAKANKGRKQVRGEIEKMRTGQ